MDRFRSKKFGTFKGAFDILVDAFIVLVRKSSFDDFKLVSVRNYVLNETKEIGDSTVSGKDGEKEIFVTVNDTRVDKSEPLLLIQN